MSNDQILDDAGSNRRIEFNGEGSTYFGIAILNAVLIVFTLGFYYPWAKTKTRQFFTSNTYMAGSPFSYHGTGKELFIGFLKAIGIFIIPYVLLIAAQYSGIQALQVATSFAFMFWIFCVIPFAIHGSLRYRTSRTSWRGIFFSYSGDRMEFVKLFFKNMLLTLVTLGIYSSWASVNIRRYMVEHIHLGNVKLSFRGSGKQLFFIILKGIFLTIITLGIYSYWFMKNLFNFYVENMTIEQNDNTVRITSTVTGGGIFLLGLVNMLLIVFTLGIAIPWVIVRTINFYLNHISIDNSFKPDMITQDKIDNFSNATGDDLVDILDIAL